MEKYQKEYEKQGLCHRCGNALSGKQERWCSLNCSRLGLKREYKSRTGEKTKAYRHKYRKASSVVLSPLRSVDVRKFLEGKECRRCKTTENLNCHHIVPRRSGGTHSLSNLMALCFTCHMQWEKRMKGYWK